MISPAPTAGLYILKVYTRKPCVSAGWGRRGSSPLDGSGTSTGQSKPLPANCPELFFTRCLRPTGPPIDTSAGRDFLTDATQKHKPVEAAADRLAGLSQREKKMSPDGISDVSNAESQSASEAGKTAEQNLLPLVGRGVM